MITFKMNNLRQFLAKRIYTGKYLLVDYWSILHIVLFYFIGTYYPGKWVHVILGSVIFEIVESGLSKKVPFLRENTKDTVSDLLFNFAGYWLGINYGGLI